MIPEQLKQIVNSYKKGWKGKAPFIKALQNYFSQVETLSQTSTSYQQRLTSQEALAIARIFINHPPVKGSNSEAIGKQILNGFYLGEDGARTFTDAAYEGSLELVQFIADHTPPEQWPAMLGNPDHHALHWALRNGHHNIAKYIMQLAKQCDCWEAIKNTFENDFIFSETIGWIIQGTFEKKPGFSLETILNIPFLLDKMEKEERPAFYNDKYQIYNTSAVFNLYIAPYFSKRFNEIIKKEPLSPEDIETAYLIIRSDIRRNTFINRSIALLQLPQVKAVLVGDKAQELWTLAQQKNDQAALQQLFTHPNLSSMATGDSLSDQQCHELEVACKHHFTKMGISFTSSYHKGSANQLSIQITFETLHQWQAFQQAFGANFPDIDRKDLPWKQNLDIGRDSEALAAIENIEKMRSPLACLKSNSAGHALINTIARGMNHSSNYPSASINTDKNGQPYVIVMTKPLADTDIDAWENDALDNFFEMFPYLCHKNDLSPLPGHDSLTIKKTLPGDLTKYEFHISPDTLHKLLMEECQYYQGYRAGYSVYDLAHPEYQYYKPGTMCLFPILSIDDQSVWIRNAGCNVSEVLSVQLSVLIQQTMPKLAKNLAIQGHHTSPIMQTLNISSDELNQAALRCAHVLKETAVKSSYHEAFDGFVQIPACAQNIKPMDEATQKLYYLSAATPSELSQLQSYEVPMQHYLHELLNVLTENKNTKGAQSIKSLIDKITPSTAPSGGMSTHLSSCGLSVTPQPGLSSPESKITLKN